MGSPRLYLRYVGHDYAVSLPKPAVSNACHHLLEIYPITIRAEACGADGWEDIHICGQAQADCRGP